MIDDNTADLGRLLTLEQEVRQAESLTALTPIICNRSRDIVEYTQAALAITSASGQIRISGFSDIAILDRTAPLVAWLEEQLKQVDADTEIFQPSEDERKVVADLIPENILILPLRSANKGALGAFIVTEHSPSPMLINQC